MAVSINFGYPDVMRSITNPNVRRQDALDVDFPMAFLTFIKTVNVSYEPEAIQNYYNAYIRLWNKTSTEKKVSDNELIVFKYREFLKDISLNYTTIEEKRFLKKIDFSDPYDLDIAIGFYSRKLKEISLKYNKKREELKFEVTKKNLKGTNFGCQRNLRELIISNLEELEDSKILIDFTRLKKDLEIEIEELYDGYPLYFNQSPSNVYDNKDLDYGSDIFLKSTSELISEIFSDVSDEIKELKEVNSLFDNKKKLTEKYISTDFYYLSTGSTTTEFVSGRILEASLPSSNFANRNYPTTASTERNNLLSVRSKGFFRPTNTSIITIDGKNSSYFFNLDTLEPNTVYYFPDPAIIGNNGDILTFIVDDSYLKRNYSSGNAKNQPSSFENDTKFFGYHSQIDPNLRKYLDSLFDQGYIQDSKRDLYNNIYGLLKEGDNFKETIKNDSSDRIVKNLILNGHTFYDDLFGEGYSFDYSVVDDSTFNETKRTGLSSNTNGFSQLSGSYYTLFFRYFSPYDELVAPTEKSLITIYEINDGAFFLNSVNAPFADSSSDLFSFTGNETLYYNILAEGGINNDSPLQRALLDPSYPALTANMSKSIRPNGTDSFLMDGGTFTESFDFDYSFGTNEYSFINEVNNSSVYSIEEFSTETYYNRYQLPGTIYIKNTQSKEVLPLLSALPYLSNKLANSIVHELSAIAKFELVNNILFIETANHLVIEGIEYTDGLFIDPKSAATHTKFNDDDFNKVSNRFKLKNKVYYCITHALSTTMPSNDLVVYPEIYEFDLTTFKNTKIFPIKNTDITLNTDFYSLSGGNVRYTSIDNPTLTHNTRNNIFNVSFLAKDQNNLFYLHEYDFDLSPRVQFRSHERFKPTEDQVSNIFVSGYEDTVSIFLSSGSPTLSSEELVI